MTDERWSMIDDHFRFFFTKCSIIDRSIDRSMDPGVRSIDGSTDRSIDGWMDRWMDGSMDRSIENSRFVPEHFRLFSEMFKHHAFRQKAIYAREDLELFALRCVSLCTANNGTACKNWVGEHVIKVRATFDDNRSCARL